MSYMKKGLSQMVQSVLIMTLSVIALFTIFGYVKDLSKDFENQLSPTVDCIQQKSKAISTCINSEGKVLVNLDVGIGEKINNLNLRVGSESFSCNPNTCSSCSIQGEGMKTIYLNPKNAVSNQDTIISSINGCTPEQLTINPC